MQGVRRGGEGCVYAHVSGAGRRGKISVLDSTRECDTARHGKKSEREEQARREGTCMYSTIASGGGAELHLVDYIAGAETATAFGAS